MTFNPHSAFPKQSTYTPYVEGRGFQRAANAPSLGAGVGPASGPPHLTSAARYSLQAQKSTMTAQGAPGVGQRMAFLAGRPSPLNDLYEKTAPKKPKQGPVPAQSGATPGGGIGEAAPQPADQGIPNRPMQDKIFGMADRVINGNVGRKVSGGMFDGGVLLGGATPGGSSTPQRNSFPWDNTNKPLF